MEDESGDGPNVEKAFRNALRKAWEDGRISYDERTVIAQFSDGLPISPEKISELETREYIRYRWRDYETTAHAAQLELAEKGLSIDPENDFLWMKKGTLQYLLGDLEGALDSLERSLELDPLSEEAWFWKGVTYTTHGDLDAALDCFERSLEQESDHTLSWVMLSRVERKLGNLDKSKACAKRAIESSPDHPIGFIERALTGIAMERMKEAEEDIKLALERDPDNGMALEIKALLVGARDKKAADSAGRTTESGDARKRAPGKKATLKGTAKEANELEVKKAVKGMAVEKPTSAEPNVPEVAIDLPKGETHPPKGHSTDEEGPVIEDGTVPGPIYEKDLEKAVSIGPDIPSTLPEKVIEKRSGSYLDDDMFDEGPKGPNTGPKEEMHVQAEEEAIEEETVEIVYKVIPCPKCGSDVPITTMERPVVVVCDTCGAKGRIMK